jgi:hypothetical protein
MSDTKPPDVSSEDLETLKEVRTAPDRAGPPPEQLEPGELIEAELGRLVSHPRAETARLEQVAADGERGSTPFIELVLVARWIVPLVAVVVGIMLLIYYEA